jgi:hypothetical protein
MLVGQTGVSGAAAGPVVDLTGREAGEAGEAGLADAGASEEGVELGLQERSPPLVDIEITSIPKATALSLKRARHDPVVRRLMPISITVIEITRGAPLSPLRGLLSNDGYRDPRAARRIANRLYFR